MVSTVSILVQKSMAITKEAQKKAPRGGAKLLAITSDPPHQDATDSKFTERVEKFSDFGGADDDFAGDWDVLTNLKNIFDLGNRVSDLEPREFAVVTGLAPISDVCKEGFVYAIKRSEGRNNVCCFFCYEKNTFNWISVF